MEDIELSRRLRALAPPGLPARSASSPRAGAGRQHGVWRTILLMWRLRWRYWRGASAEALAAGLPMTRRVIAALIVVGQGAGGGPGQDAADPGAGRGRRRGAGRAAAGARGRRRAWRPASARSSCAARRDASHPPSSAAIGAPASALAAAGRRRPRRAHAACAGARAARRTPRAADRHRLPGARRRAAARRPPRRWPTTTPCSCRRWTAAMRWSACAGRRRGLFDGMPWSTPQVMAQTRERAGARPACARPSWRRCPTSTSPPTWPTCRRTGSGQMPRGAWRDHPERRRPTMNSIRSRPGQAGTTRWDWCAATATATARRPTTDARHWRPSPRRRRPVERLAAGAAAGVQRRGLMPFIPICSQPQRTSVPANGA